MTREQAKEEYVKKVLGNRVGIYDCGWDMIDKVYDSIGTCEECKQWNNDELGKWCSVSSDDMLENDYCSKFIQK